MRNQCGIGLVDDDDDIRDALCQLLTQHGHRVHSYKSARQFLLALEDEPDDFACVISDIRMPGISGLDLFSDLRRRNVVLPVILITGFGDVEVAVGAMKAGASDIVLKPIKGERLISSVSQAIAKFRKEMVVRSELAEIAARYDLLSSRQKAVMRLAASGHANKEIAALLGLSIRTVEHYREWVMHKMHARNLAELVHIAIKLGIAESSPSEAPIAERRA